MLQRSDGYDQLLTFWSIQESLLQTYRSIFVTVQSIIFAIAAAITQSNPSSSIILTILGVFLLLMWHKVCSKRAVDVSFVQWLLMQAENGNSVSQPLTIFKRFQAGETITIGDKSVVRGKKKKRLVSAIKQETVEMLDVPFVGKSITRVWMETVLPIIFLLLWFFVATLAIKAFNADVTR